MKYALYLFLTLIAAGNELADAISSKQVLNQQQLNTAYENQKHLVLDKKKLGSKVIGFKGGIMSDKAYPKFLLPEPVTGVFFEGAKLEPLGDQDASYITYRSEAKQLKVELEFAYKLATDINATVKPSDLKSLISEFSASVELPDFYFTNRPSGDEVIRTNVLSHRFIIGQWQSFDQKSLQAVNKSQVQLRCGQTVVTQGEGSNALGDQEQALSWMINHLLAQGFELKKDMILLTGNLAKMVDAKPCDYKAEFSGFESIYFTIKE